MLVLVRVFCRNTLIHEHEDKKSFLLLTARYHAGTFYSCLHSHRLNRSLIYRLRATEIVRITIAAGIKTSVQDKSV